MVRLYWINFLFIVDELTAHSEDLDWDDIVTYLGQAKGLFEEKRNFSENSLCGGFELY
jgi:hypothetical protein